MAALGRVSIDGWITAAATAVTAAVVVLNARATHRASRPTVEMAAWASTETVLGFTVRLRNRTTLGIRMLNVALLNPYVGELSLHDPHNKFSKDVEPKMYGRKATFRESVEPGGWVELRYFWYLPEPVSRYSVFRISVGMWEMERASEPEGLIAQATPSLIREMAEPQITESPVWAKSTDQNHRPVPVVLRKFPFL